MPEFIHTVLSTFIISLSFTSISRIIKPLALMNTQKEKNPNKRTRSYVEEAFRQIQAKPDVTDIIILNKAGNPVKSSMEVSAALQMAGLYEILREKVQMGLQKMDPRDDLMMLRVRTNSNETLISPDGKITVIVVQNAKDKIQT